MRVLITNDDGIQGEGLLHLVKWAQKLGEVVVAAPKVEQSAKSQAIDIHNPFLVEEVDFMEGVRAYTVASTPADCTCPRCKDRAVGEIIYCATLVPSEK